LKGDHKMEGMFEIYFTDLTEEAQKRIMDAYHIKSPAELNWDRDFVPIAFASLPEETEEDD